MTRPVKAPHQSSATALLACGCNRIFDPPASTGGRVICTSHGPTKILVGNTDWSYYCPGCTNGRSLSRRYGQDEERAREAATEHAQTYRHVVQIRHAGNVVGTLDGNM